MLYVFKRDVSAAHAIIDDADSFRDGFNVNPAFADVGISRFPHPAFSGHLEFPVGNAGSVVTMQAMRVISGK